MHKNKINNKVYIGYTSLSANKRWGANGRRYLAKKGGKYAHSKFAYAIQKYGWDNFEHIILKDNIETIEEAHKLECELISQYNATDDRCGYNMTCGGEGTKGKQHTEETKLKISRANKNITTKTREKFREIAKNRSAETRKKIGMAHKGCEPWNKGKTNIYSAETLKRMSESASKRTKEKNGFYGKAHSTETKEKIRKANSKQIYCVEENRYFQSIKQASEIMNIDKSCISGVLCGRHRTAGGLHWEYGRDQYLCIF